ncbi:PREDICTED: tigger transposable element-derived protein 6-like [Trachymyrmex cornetzi]|uniref:tigger transposable element-derived protein 6-like n=1 Tax=Trachymyrmex cornetzi TaxID=471704 RepID=UPI00084F24C7|nr:PREDICTED: tigger transposable element-derived protein 6-like [Trachymyrmex cornetzi]XP_018372742.1 PREDICTED: tigger transposable element-derived protein 6-like [Trachymyrmex cornetzi]XP_018372743.1 PREDICTED: tigger transposable element-derived protein 6-like [Trachymyrmex cornetzi]
MPRYYKRTSDKNNWTEGTLKSAIYAVKVNGMKIRAAGRKFNISESTLRKRLKESSTSHVPLGRKPTFTVDEEKELTNHILNLAKLFYGLTSHQLRRIAFDFAEAKHVNHTFNKTIQLAGKDWLYQFLQRNSEIKLRQPKGTSLNRINAFNKEEITRFFSNLQEVMEKYRFPPNRIFNMDKMCITLIKKKCPKIYGAKGIERIGTATSGERRRTVTTVFCMNASGTYIPPMIIYPRARMNTQLQKNGPIGAIYACSKNGWINKGLYLDWLHHFKSYVKPTCEDPVLLIIDNHTSYISLDAFDLCKSGFITVLSFPPHTSHRIQPLDLTFFGPLKNALYREYDLYLKLTDHKKITEYNLAELLNKAFLKVASMKEGISGFRTAGIYPLNPDRFDENDFAPSVAREGPLTEVVFDNQNSNSIETISNIDNLPDSYNNESEANPISKPSTSKTPDQFKITVISSISSSKPHVAT